MAEKGCDISVVIVSYNCRNVLRMALASLKRAVEGVSSEVFVVDNASSDGTLDMLRENYQWVNAIDAGGNLGFSRANNIALRQCRGKVIMLLNPDTVVSATLVRGVIKHFADNPDSGAVGVHMINGFGRYLRESKRGYPDVLTSFCKVTGLWRINPKSAKLNNYYLGTQSADGRCEAPILVGACMAFTRQLMDKAGMFDESYFMYCEDTDLSWRMHKASEGNQYLGDIRIVHFKGESTPRHVKYIYSFYNASLIFARRHELGHRSALTRCVVYAGIGVAFLLAAVKSQVLRLKEALVRKPLPNSVLLITDNEEAAQRFRECCVANSVEVAPTGALAADYLPQGIKAVVFDVEGDIDAVIAYMKRHSGRCLFGFYSSADEIAFVYLDNWCQSIFR